MIERNFKQKWEGGGGEQRFADPSLPMNKIPPLPKICQESLPNKPFHGQYTIKR